MCHLAARLPARLQRRPCGSLTDRLTRCTQVLWDRSQPIQRWERMVEWLEARSAVAPVFRYFPIQILHHTSASAVSERQSSPVGAPPLGRNGTRLPVGCSAARARDARGAGGNRAPKPGGLALTGRPGSLPMDGAFGHRVSAASVRRCAAHSRRALDVKPKALDQQRKASSCTATTRTASSPTAYSPSSSRRRAPDQPTLSPCFRRRPPAPARPPCMLFSFAGRGWRRTALAARSSPSRALCCMCARVACSARRDHTGAYIRHIGVGWRGGGPPTAV